MNVTTETFYVGLSEDQLSANADMTDPSTLPREITNGALARTKADWTHDKPMRRYVVKATFVADRDVTIPTFVVFARPHGGPMILCGKLETRHGNLFRDGDRIDFELLIPEAH